MPGFFFARENSSAAPGLAAGLPLPSARTGQPTGVPREGEAAPLARTGTAGAQGTIASPIRRAHRQVGLVVAHDIAAMQNAIAFPGLLVFVFAFARHGFLA